jgi:hypothetical protein
MPATRRLLATAPAAIALAVGGLALASPRTLLRLYGVDRRELTGAGAFGWRLFAVRNLVTGVSALRANEGARRLILPVQAVDQLVFAHAWKTRAVPRGAAAMAMLTSGAIIVSTLVADRER